MFPGPSIFIAYRIEPGTIHVEVDAVREHVALVDEPGHQVGLRYHVTRRSQREGHLVAIHVQLIPAQNVPTGSQLQG